MNIEYDVSYAISVIIGKAEEISGDRPEIREEIDSWRTRYDSIISGNGSENEKNIQMTGLLNEISPIVDGWERNFE